MLNKIIKYILKENDIKLWSFSVLVLVFTIVFKRLIVRLLNNSIVFVWDNSSFNTTIEIIFLISFVVLLLFLSIKLLAGFIENRPKQIFILTVGLIYYYFRFIDNSYQFLTFSFFKYLAYLDFIFILAFFSILHLIVNYLKTNSKIKNTTVNKNIFNDTPWEENQQDELNRYEGAKRISRQIIELESNKPISYGIVGGWGDGKTSFLNMLRVELAANKNTIIINFNPWKSTDLKLIQKDFFKCLKEGLSTYSSEIYPAINKYLEIIFEYDKTEISKLISYFVQEHYQILNTFDNVNKAFRKLNKKVIIIIDDIDRLDSKEIFEVVKLIRNNGNFTNTIFIAAFDKIYVNNAIKKYTAFNNDYFLEKIFQQEIILPSYPHSILTNKLINNLKEYYKNDTRTLVDIEKKLKFIPDEYSSILGRTGKITEHIFTFITNLRDVKRFTNSFIHSYDSIKEDVELIDFFHLELLKTKSLSVYESIRKRVILKETVSNLGSYSFDEDNFNTLHENLINKNEVKSLLKILFPDDNKNYDPRSISFQKSFLVYFSNKLFDRLSRSVFNRIFFDYDEVKIKEWIENKYLSDIIEYLTILPYTSFKNKGEFENYIALWFFLIEEGYEINFDFIITLFEEGEHKQKIVKRLYKNKGEFELIFKKKIQNAKIPFHIRKLLYKLITNYQYNKEYKFFMSENDIKKQALTYLKKFLKTNPDLTNEGMWLYYTCVHFIDEDKYVHLLPDASNILREFLNNHPDFYLNTYIRPLYTPDDNHTRTGEPFAKSIFETYDNFKEFLNNNKKHHKYKINVEFFNRFEKNKYNPVYYEVLPEELKSD